MIHGKTYTDAVFFALMVDTFCALEIAYWRNLFNELEGNCDAA